MLKTLLNQPEKTLVFHSRKMFPNLPEIIHNQPTPNTHAIHNEMLIIVD